MRVHAALQGSLDVVRKGVRGECENRNTPRVFPCHAAYVPCGFKAVHNRHTDIHQDSGVFPGSDSAKSPTATLPFSAQTTERFLDSRSVLRISAFRSLSSAIQDLFTVKTDFLRHGRNIKGVPVMGHHQKHITQMLRNTGLLIK